MLYTKYRKVKLMPDSREKIKIVERANSANLIFNLRSKELESEKIPLQRTSTPHSFSKHLLDIEYEADSLLYTMKEQMNKRYNQHLRLIKPIFSRYPKIWKELEKSEQNVKGFKGWMNQMKGFYLMLLAQDKYTQILLENQIDLQEIQSGLLLLESIRQVFNKQQKFIRDDQNQANKTRLAIGNMEQGIHIF